MKLFEVSGLQRPTPTHGARGLKDQAKTMLEAIPPDVREASDGSKPWSEGHDDRPTNGLALCRLCHWSFDEGLRSVGVKYEVLVSKRVQVEQNLPGHILTLRDRHIFTPNEDQYWPAQDTLNHHRSRRLLR